ncbi:hypothetical protein [Methermicoccus shengliensis]|uniref:hypothetical protein n=1 Tax=Methermicoccus shengliensis TaxID=660064 RepID=UPI0012F65C56|nr:hypothetical protein [Methermicoccus shengliensis]
MSETIFEIDRVPKEIRIELPKHGETHPKLILELPVISEHEDKKLYPETVGQTYFDDSREANNTAHS